MSDFEFKELQTLTEIFDDICQNNKHNLITKK